IPRSTGIVHQDVNGTEFLFGLSEHLPHFVSLRGVGSHHDGLGTEPFDRLHEAVVVRGRGPPVRPVVQDDVRALPRQRERGTSPHALARTAGNESDAAIERPCQAPGNGTRPITLPGPTGLVWRPSKLPPEAPKPSSPAGRNLASR